MSAHGDGVLLPRPPQRPASAAALLFCLPYAGGGALAYGQWPRLLGPQIDVRAAHLPRRETRLHEDGNGISPQQIAQELAPQINRPYALYGHSMGARLGFEVIRCLRRLGAPMPVRFYAAGCQAPEYPPSPVLRGLSRFPDEELVARLVELGMAPAELAGSPELRDLILPSMRLDFGWIDDTAFEPGEPLEVPVTVFAGAQDDLVTEAGLEGWAAHTAAAFARHTLPGGHLFLNEDRGRAQLLALIGPDLLDAADGGHTIPLPGTGWSVWRDAVLRGTGFPAEGLLRFSSPEAAEAADRALADPAGTAAFEAVFERAQSACSAEARELAADPRMREAVTWQNTNALHALDGLRRPSSNRMRRQREKLVARYWQRYTAKNETVGFFGPCCWVEVDGGDEPVTVRTGEGLIRERRVHLEQWAVQALADALAADPAVRRALPPLLGPQWALRERTLTRAAAAPSVLSAAEAAVVGHCDGRRPATAVVAELVGELGLRSPEDGFLLLEQLADRGVLQWPTRLAIGPWSQRELRERLEAIEDPEVRERAMAAWRTLEDARAAVAAAAGNPEALRAAMARLDEVFTALTGADPRRRAGQMYSGRALCVEETSRDAEVVFGRPLLEALAAPLDILLRGARWLTAAIAEAYGSALAGLYDELAADAPGGEVDLNDLWFLAQGMLFGADERPVDLVSAQFVRRCAELFGLDEVPESATRVQLSAAELLPRAEKLFDADRPGWSAGRLHSPDLHVCAADERALARGEFIVVLGELHTAWATFDTAVLSQWHPEPGRLRAALTADLGPGRIRPLLPADWPRNTGRVAADLADRTDPQLGYTDAPGPDPDRLLRAGQCTVLRRPGDPHEAVRVYAPDGRVWPLIEAFSSLVAIHAVDGFKLVAAAAHTPRVTVDRFVAVRESWRITVGECGLAEAKGEPARFLAARRLRARLGLPERVFVKIATETKPVYTDFTSPLHVSALCTMVRSVWLRSGADASLVLSELLPGPEDAWLPDGTGARYFTELRLQLTDRARPGHG